MIEALQEAAAFRDSDIVVSSLDYNINVNVLNN